MAFPPAVENLDVPHELIDEGSLFSGEIVAIGGKPVIKVRYPIADQAEFHGGFDPGEIIMLSVCLPSVKELMALVASMHDACFPLRQNPLDKRPFRLFAVGEEDFLHKEVRYYFKKGRGRKVKHELPIKWRY